MKTKLIRYFGGKGGALTNIIKSLIPKDYEIYVEPYGGSAAVLFSQKANIEVYNDLYDNVYSLFKVMSDEDMFFKFKRRLELTPYSEKLYREYKLKLKEKDLSEIDRAYHYFYVNRTSVNSVGGFSSSIIPRRNLSKPVSDYLSSIDGLEEYHKRISEVLIFNRDAIEIINKYDSKDTFIYLDPPYRLITRKSNARYDIDMEDDEHKELLSTIIKCDSKILLSGYDNDMYNDILEGWNKETFIIKNKKPETLWYNYEISG
jgi:DNA adenine methylase